MSGKQPAPPALPVEVVQEFLDLGNRIIADDDLYSFASLAQQVHKATGLEVTVALIYLTAGFVGRHIANMLTEKVPPGEDTPAWISELYADITGAEPPPTSGPVTTEQDLHRRAQRAGLVIAKG